MWQRTLAPLLLIATPVQAFTAHCHDALPVTCYLVDFQNLELSCSYDKTMVDLPSSY
jgi:hypothetical protein